MGTIGIIANPASGKDVRRLVARASVFDNQEKQAIVRRIIVGAIAAGADSVAYLDDGHGIVRTALAEVGDTLRRTAVAATETANALDTISAARALQAAGCDVVITLGGDGTNRAFTLGWRDATVIPISTGTNNVFPVLAEPTIAGMVAGLLAGDRLDAADLGQRAKLLHVRGADRRGNPVADVGLVDAVLLRRDHVGNLLPFDAARIDRILLTRAEPGAVGMSPIGGLLDVVDAADDEGLLVEMGPGVEFTAPLSPGAFQTVSVRSVTRIPLDVPVPFRGPGVLALDGDRDHRVADQRGLTVSIRRDGPFVIDIDAAMRAAVGRGIIAPNFARGSPD